MHNTTQENNIIAQELIDLQTKINDNNTKLSELLNTKNTEEQNIKRLKENLRPFKSLCLIV